NTRSQWLIRVVDQNGSVIVETNIRTVCATDLFAGPNDHGTLYFAFLNFRVRDGFLDRNNDHISNRSIATLRATEYLNALHSARTGVIGHLKPCLHLNHDVPLSFCTKPNVAGRSRPCPGDFYPQLSEYTTQAWVGIFLSADQTIGAFSRICFTRQFLSRDSGRVSSIR